ncbi:hypothetical protein POTOM_031168 [Populus tomentosa]|uniref:Uncharacterized protein n=1 Tax=Populus tomentosa TaxID=118781 RepID=A0A8X8CSA0_POPTO|nr:hypothetical protein POTOM_031168 [Populus tomentosa]
MENRSNPPPHVLIFPLPCQGHVNSMLKLAELLSLAGIKITFLNSEHNHELLARYTNIEDRFTKYPGFQFQTIADGLPVDHPRSGGQLMELFDAMKLVTKPIFKKILLETKPPVNCIIGDGILGFVGDVAIEVGVPVIYFRTVSACSFWAYFSIFDIIESGQLPIRGDEDMDRLITKVPGMETFLRCRDLPSFCREFVRSATRMAELSRKSVREGGSSYCNLNRLIEDIRSMSVRVHDT